MANPEATRLLRIARRDLKMARKLLDPDVEEPSWGWAAQQCLEKTLKAWLHSRGIQPPTTHDIARLLLLLQKAGVDITELKPLRAFSTFAVQCRYDDDPDELGLDRAAWCNRAEALPPPASKVVTPVNQILGGLMEQPLLSLNTYEGCLQNLLA